MNKNEQFDLTKDFIRAKEKTPELLNEKFREYYDGEIKAIGKKRRPQNRF